MDVVYIVGPGEREFLRYSLRSLVNLPHDRVFIVGERPGWVSPETVTHIQTKQVTPKWASATHNMMTAAECKDISEEFVFMNDDFFIIRPIDHVPALNRGTLSEVIEEVTATVGNSSWVQGMHETRRMLVAAGYDDPLCYELHVPMVFRKPYLRQAILWGTARRNPSTRARMTRTVYGNIHHVGGETAADVKLHSRQLSVETDLPFRSSAPDTWRTGTLNDIRDMFPSKCVYER